MSQGSRCSRLKVCVAVPFDLVGIMGGARTRIINDLKALQLAGFETEVVFPSAERIEDLREHIDELEGCAASIHCHTIRSIPHMLGLRSRKMRQLGDTHSFPASPFFRMCLEKLIGDFDILIANYPFSAYPALKSLHGAVPCVLECHDFQYGWAQSVTRSRLYRAAIHHMEAYCCQGADLVLAPSCEDRAALIKEYAVPDERVVVVPNHVDVSNCKTADKNSTRQQYGLLPSDTLILFHGAMDYRPNTEAARFIIDELSPVVLRALPQAKFMIVGAGMPREIVERAGQNVVCFSDVARIAPFLSMADIAVVPLKYGEGTRLKLLECFAFKLPVISTAKGAEGLKFVPGTHVLMAERNAEEFSQAISTLVVNPRMRRLIAENAFKLVNEEYDVKSVARTLSTILPRLVK